MTINQPQTLEQLQATLGDLPAADLPVALFPVRLETRFRQQGTTAFLCVRIYPDELHVESHEPELTADEERWGRYAWEQAWRAGGEAAAEHAIQDELAKRFGPGRAAWIVKTLAPLNPDSRPSRRVPDPAPLTAAPSFPAPARRDASWTRAPKVRALPDRWVVFAYRGTTRVLAALGEPIPSTLHAGPDPQAPPPQGRTDDRLAVDPEMQWLVDFENAVEVGMALRIPLASASEASTPYNRLLVVGVRKGDGQAAAAEVEALLHSQRYSDSLAFVPQGTPTNNTAESSSGYAASQPGLRTMLLSTTNGARGTSENNSLVTAQAAGIDPTIFDGVPHATATEQADARHANTALWPVTWGYFLRYVLRGAITDDELEQARRHYVDNVRARGPLPVLRVGRQPYGILPVISLDGYVPHGDEIVGLRTVTALRTMRDWWRRSLNRVEDVSPLSTVEAMSERLTRILMRQATTDHVRTRLALPGDLYGTPQRPGLASAVAAFVQGRSAKAMALLNTLGATGAVPGSTMVFSTSGFDLAEQLVGAAQPDGRLLEPNYIAAIRAATFAALQAERGAVGRSVNTVLYLLLRHAMLLAYAEVAYRIERDAGRLQPGSLREEALVDIHSTGGTATTFTPGPSERTLTPLRVVLDAPAPPGHTQPLRDVIHTFGAAQVPAAALLDEMRTSLDHLTSLPVQQLDGLVRETLDLTSHRFDAYVTSLATARLRRLRQVRPTGLILGGYGWVENLSKVFGGTVVSPEPAGEAIPDNPIHDTPGNRGYVAAPSLTHAATAAILRSGYRAYGPLGGPLPALAVDLSSDRVRLAQSLLDGVRQGQPLAALLGYRFERALRENGLANYIRPFRLIAPFSELYRLQAQKAALEQQKAELITAHTAARATITSAIAVLNTQISALNGQINTKTGQRTPLQTRVNSLKNTLIPPAETAVGAAEDQVALRTKEVSSLSGRPPTDERLVEAKANLASANITLKGAKDNLNALVSERNTKQSQINTLTTDINSFTSDRTAKQAEVTQKTAERNTLDQSHTIALAAKDAEIDAVQKQIEAKEAEYQARYTATTSFVAMEAIEIQHVVDGLELLRRWKAGKIEFGIGQLPSRDTGDGPGIVRQLDTLAAAVDAVSDLLTAESVHQLVQGNELRAGGTLDALARGETPPPEPDVVRTPRSGTAHTHRVAVLLTGPPGAPGGWKTDAFQQRAAAEPSLNAWLATVLPDPARVRLDVTYLHPQTGEPIGDLTWRLNSFFLSPLDAVYLAPQDGASPASALEDLIGHGMIVDRPATCPPDVRIRIQYERRADWPSDDVGFGAFLETARAARDLLAAARPVDARDLDCPEDTGESAGDRAADVAELKQRADTLTSAFRRAFGELQNALGSAVPETLDVAALRLALTRISWSGMPEATPGSIVGDAPDDRRVLVDQAESVVEVASRRAAALDAAEQGFDRSTASPRAQCELDVTRIQIVLGADFRVLPRVRPANAATLATTFGQSLSLQAGDPMAAVNWFLQVAHVRDGVARLATTLTYAEALDADARTRLTVGQLPHDATARWVALPLDPQRPARTPCVSLVAHMPTAFNPAVPLCGIMVDEWVDVVPALQETAAVAFHYDAPCVQAPQSILLAVPPDTRARWDLTALESVVQETLELAKLRAVDPTALAGDQDHGHLLPAVYVAYNDAGDTVSTDLSRAAAR